MSHRRRRGFPVAPVGRIDQLRSIDFSSGIAPPPPPTTLPTGAVTETPTSKLEVRQQIYHADNLDSKREANFNDLSCSTKVVPVDYFLKSLLPPLHSSIDIDDVVEKMKASHVIKRGRFKYFPRDPCNLPGDENRVFMRLEMLVKAIEKTAKPSKPPTLRFVHRGTVTPKPGARPSNKSRPDSFGELIDGVPGVHWQQLGFVGEVKKNSDEDSVYKVRDDRCLIQSLLKYYAEPGADRMGRPLQPS